MCGIDRKKIKSSAKIGVFTSFFGSWDLKPNY
jgi:hypothetical protein